MGKLVAQVLIAMIVLGMVTGVAVLMLLFLGQDWDDALFWILSAIMVIAGLLVVTMRDIIRCGLAMIVCFGSLAGIYVLLVVQTRSFGLSGLITPSLDEMTVARTEVPAGQRVGRRPDRQPAGASLPLRADLVGHGRRANDLRSRDAVDRHGR